MEGEIEMEIVKKGKIEERMREGGEGIKDLYKKKRIWK